MPNFLRNRFLLFSNAASIAGLGGYKFATNRIRQPFTGVASGAGSLYTVGSNRFYTPGYSQTDLRICIPNCWFPLVSSAPFEVAGDATRQIEGASLKMGGVYYPFTFNGQASHTFGTEKYIWSDPLGVTIPANTAIDIILTDYVPLGLNRPRSYNPANGKYGDLGTGSATTLSSYLTEGTIPTPPVGATQIGPCAIVAKGAPAGQPVPLVVGMSITDGSSMSVYNQIGDRPNLGYVAAAFDDDTAVEGRYAFGQFAVGSTSFLSMTEAQFATRKQMLADVGYPFTVIYCEHGQNDVGAGYSTIVSRADAGWAFLKTMGNKRLVHGGMNPLTSDASTDIYSLVSGQSVAAKDDYPTGERWLFRNYCATLPTNVDAFVDLSSYMSDPGTLDKWKAMGRDSVLASPRSAGGSAISVSGTPPIVGDKVVLGAGAVGAIVREIGAVSGSGPYLCTFATGESTTVGTFDAGAVVRATPTPDGIHPTTAIHAEVKVGLVAAKAAGIFRS